MRFPSFKHIIHNAVKVIVHYPFEFVVSVTGTSAALILTHRNLVPSTEEFLIRFLMTVSLALPSFLAVTIRSRFRKLSTAQRFIEYGAIAVLLALFYFSIDSFIAVKDIIRFLLLNITAHLMVSCAGFIKRGSTNAFWQFNKGIFLQIVTAVIFSVVLFAGLSGAIAAMDMLFAMHVNDEWYLRLFIIIAGIFNTLFFLSGIPDDAGQLETTHEYPKVLKVFTQFVLVPLVIIYLIILLAYETKIIVLWSLPQGWVSNLILAYGVAGILSILLVYPIRSTEDNNWIKTFAGWFYVLLLPLVALMLVAIGTRISAYGFTEERILVLLLAIWLACMSLYYLFKPNGDIRIIPLSLACVAVFLNFAAFPIAKNSQRNRLHELLQRNNLLSDNVAIKAKEGQKIPFKDRKNISSIVYYLLQNHGKKSLQPWFQTDSLKEEKYNAYSNADILIRSLGMTYVDDYRTEDDSAKRTAWQTFYSKNEGITINGFDYLIPFERYGRNEDNYEKLYARVENDGMITIHDSSTIIVTVDSRSFFYDLAEKYSLHDNDTHYLSKEQMRQDTITEHWKIAVYYDQLEGYTYKPDKSGSLSGSGIILLKKK